MKLLVFILIVLSNFLNTNINHDSILAKFRVIERGEVFFLEVEFEEQNIVKLNKTNSLHVTNKEFELYLNETTEWILNKKKVNPKVLAIEKNGYHKKAICLLSKKQKNIKSIVVKNKFLLDVKSHINVLVLEINNTIKDFQLDNNRITVSVNYN